jgi:hypothetical protein
MNARTRTGSMRVGVAVVAAGIGCAIPQTSGVQPAVVSESGVTTAQIRIPESMRAEHGEIQAELERITKMPGRLGTAARELAAVLHPHFVREEQIALPPLGLLEPLSRGEVTAGMRGVLPMTDSLRAELPRMLEEHKGIRGATLRLRDAARAEGNADIEQFADRLALHARSEEELFYPAAILVGDLIRVRVGPRTGAVSGGYRIIRPATAGFPARNIRESPSVRIGR